MIAFLSECFCIWLMIHGFLHNRKCTEPIQATVTGYEYDCGEGIYAAQFEYEYSGEKYNGKTWHAPDHVAYNSTMKKKHAEEYYPIGCGITVYIDPNVPSNYTLHPSIGITAS